jgi:hypothetical protein
MRNWASAILIAVIVSGAGKVSAASRKSHGQFDDLFGAVASASATRHHKSLHRSHHAKGRHLARSPARELRGTQVAAADVPAAPASSGDPLVLSDYAPNRHAWVGP